MTTWQVTSPTLRAFSRSPGCLLQSEDQSYIIIISVTLNIGVPPSRSITLPAASKMNSHLKLKFRDRIARAAQQARENRFEWQTTAYWLSDAWTKAQGLPLALIGIYGLNERRAEQIFSIFERFLPWFVLIFLLPYIVVAFSLAAAFVSRMRETYAGEPSRIAEGIPIEESVRRFVIAKASDSFSIGGAIEVLKHPFLDKRISNNGWHSQSVSIKRSRRIFDVPDRLRSKTTFEGDNNQKYSLIRSSRPTTDDFGRLSLEVAPTTFFDIERARRITDHDQKLRHELSDLAPENHQIPNSLCLHAIVLLRGGHVLAIKRREQTSYFPGAISISFEEQLAEVDFTTPGIEPSESLFRRAICEEIFPLADRYEIDPQDSWNRISSAVDHYRYWSLLFEEKIGNFSLFGVCKLRLNLLEYLSTFRKIQDEYGGKRDDEGKLYYTSLECLRDYLRSGHGTIRVANFYDSSKDDFEAIRSVHPTMPYRGATLLSCL